VNLKEIKQQVKHCYNFTAMKSSEQRGWNVLFDMDDVRYTVKTKRSEVRFFKTLNTVARYIASISNEITDFKVVL
jgi:hypothetical protein